MKKPFEILFYTTPNGIVPVRDFLKSLPKADRLAAGAAIQQLEILGFNLRMPLSRKIEGEKELFELRVLGENNTYRIFYFHHTGKTYILLHAFTKKSRKTPEKEIKIAADRRTDYLRRTEN